MTGSFLSIRGISKAFGGLVAVEEVSLEVPKGEFLTFLGPSGSGKSTTLYAIAGLLDPTAGEVFLNGRSLLAVPSHKRDIGMVFQRYTLFPHLTVGENVAFPLRVRGRSRAEVDAKVEEMLALVRLDGFRDRMPTRLSGGQQQRVALARALAYDPAILLMDEPLSALDKKLREEIQFEIRRIHRETGVTILYVTHDQEEALRLSDRIALFNRGRIEQIGSGEDLYHRPASEFVASFIGNSNFIDAELVSASNGAAAARLPDGVVIADIQRHGAATSGRAKVMLRPEMLEVAAEPGPGRIAAVLRDKNFIGESLHLFTETSWGETLDVRVPIAAAGRRPYEIGQPIWLSFEPASAHAFPG